MIILDWSHTGYRYLFANLPSIQENTDLFAHLLLHAVTQASSRFRASKENPLVLAVDCRSKNNWRKDVWEEFSWKFEEYQDDAGYKGNRKKNDDIPWDKIFGIMDEVRTLIDTSTDFVTVFHERAEADDVIYCGSKYSEARGEETTIISSDKDFKQLISKKTHLYDPIKRKFIKESNPRSYLKKHILMGDGVDNIKSCRKRLGPKTAEKLLPNLEGYLEVDDDLRARYEFNKKLIDLSELPSDIDDAITKQFANMEFNYNMMNIMKFCKKYKLKNIINGIDNFSLR